MVLVVGGQSRKVGKTSVAVGLIRALPWAEWTTVKVTHHHMAKGWKLEREESSAGDSGRYLAAGARESWFLRASPESLPQAIPELRRLLSASRNTLLESNSVLSYLEPDVYLLVLDERIEDLKASALRHYAKADAYVVVEPARIDNVDVLPGRPRFAVTRPSFQSALLTRFVAERLIQAAGIATRSVNPSSLV